MLIDGGYIDSLGVWHSGCSTLTPGKIELAPAVTRVEYQVTPSQATVPTECRGDVHVFPCKHCGQCKCGKARLAKDGGQ